jgi:HK97 family phage major capsid protein
MPKDFDEIKSAQEQLGKAFHAFKEKNDERIDELKKNGVTDVVLKDHVDRINSEITELSTKVDKAIAQAGRPKLGSNEDAETKLRNEAATFFSLTAGKKVKPEEADVETYKSYVNTFETYLRRGDKGAGIMNSMSVGSDPEGGYFVPATMDSRIVTRIFETSPMRTVADQITIGTDALEYPLDTNEGVSGGWVAEKESRSESDTPDVGTGRIPVHEQYSEPRVTQKLLDDAQIDVAAWLEGKTADKMIRTENTAFVSGTGVGKPRGFLDYASAAVTTKDASRAWGKLQYKPTGVSADFGASGSGSDELIDLVHTMKPQYRAGAVWTANRLTMAEVRKLKDGQGNYLWQMGNVQNGQPAQLLGFGIVEMEDMPDIAANIYAMAFANFKEGYQIVDRQGIRVLRDPYTAKPYVKFYMTRRVGGDVKNFDAIKLLKFGTS